MYTTIPRKIHQCIFSGHGEIIWSLRLWRKIEHISQSQAMFSVWCRNGASFSQGPSAVSQISVFNFQKQLSFAFLCWVTEGSEAAPTINCDRNAAANILLLGAREIIWNKRPKPGQRSPAADDTSAEEGAVWSYSKQYNYNPTFHRRDHKTFIEYVPLWCFLSRLVRAVVWLVPMISCWMLFFNMQVYVRARYFNDKSAVCAL